MIKEESSNNSTTSETSCDLSDENAMVPMSEKTAAQLINIEVDIE